MYLLLLSFFSPWLLALHRKFSEFDNTEVLWLMFLYIFGWYNLGKNYEKDWRRHVRKAFDMMLPLWVILWTYLCMVWSYLALFRPKMSNKSTHAHTFNSVWVGFLKLIIPSIFLVIIIVSKIRIMYKNWRTCVSFDVCANII